MIPFTRVTLLTKWGYIIAFETGYNKYFVLRYDKNEVSDYPWDFLCPERLVWCSFSCFSLGGDEKLGFTRLKDAVNACKRVYEKN